MKKRMKTAFAGLAFVAGCEIGIAIQLMKMIHNYTIKDKAISEPAPEDAAPEIVPEDAAQETVPEDAAQETAQDSAENRSAGTTEDV